MQLYKITTFESSVMSLPEKEECSATAKGESTNHVMSVEFCISQCQYERQNIV